MQFRNFFFWSRSLLCFLLFLSFQWSFAQKLTTNESGEKIVLFDDGSWRYFDPATDASLEEAQPSSRPVVQTEEVFPKTSDTPEAAGKKTKKAKTTKGTKKKEKISKNKKNKSTKSTKNKNSKAKKNKKASKGKKAKKGKSSSKQKTTKTDIDPEVQRQSDQLALRRAERAASEANKMQRVLEDLALERSFLEEELKAAYSNMEMTDADIVKTEGKLKQARLQEEAAAEKYKIAIDLADQYERMVNMSYQKREKLLAKMNQEIPSADNPQITTANLGEKRMEEVDIQRTKAEEKQAMEIKEKRIQMDVMLYPPTPPCNLVFEGVDEFTGKMRKEMGKMPFFSFTNEKMRAYLKDKDFISCQGALSDISGGLYILSLDLEVASPNAQKDYGYIEKGSVLTLKFIDGSIVRLYNRKTDLGTLNPLDKSVIYKPQYTINSSQAKDIAKGEVDLVRVVWSTGYEDYEVYELDFFINQFRCLEEK